MFEEIGQQMVEIKLIFSCVSNIVGQKYPHIVLLNYASFTENGVIFLCHEVVTHVVQYFYSVLPLLVGALSFVEHLDAIVDLL